MNTPFELPCGTVLKNRLVKAAVICEKAGFRSFDFCNQALEDGALDLVGMARPFLTNLNDIPAFLEGKVDKFENLVLRTGIKAFDSTAEGPFYAHQIIQLANGKEVKMKMSPIGSSMFFVLNIIGLGCGPLVIGFLSDTLEPTYGDLSLRYAFTVTYATGIIAIILFYLAAQNYEKDLQKITT